MSDSPIQVTSFKRQKFWHVQISAMFEGDLLSCDMKVEALSANHAVNFCVNEVTKEIALSEFSEDTKGEDIISVYLSAAMDKISLQIHSGIIFKRIVLVTNPAMMCAGGSGMRISASEDKGKKEQLAWIESKESGRNKNYG